VTTEEPDYSKIPSEYSEKTVNFIKKFLIKERGKWPLIKEMIQELEDHAYELFAKSKVKIKFPPPTTSWAEISKKID